MASKVYLVEQTLTRQRTVMVWAASKKDAEQKAKDGYGEILDRAGKWSLLCQEAREAED